jgi:hypothetical protein
VVLQPSTSQSDLLVQRVEQYTGAASVGTAEIDDVKAATTERTVTKAKRILSEDVI